MIKKLSDNKKIKNDIILVAVIIIVAAAGLLILNLAKEKGDIVSVKINGAEAYSFSINENVDTVIYTGENKTGENRLLIKNGKVYIFQANCPDKICVKHRAIENAGESIVCLPHKVVVEIISTETDIGMDMAVQ